MHRFFIGNNNIQDDTITITGEDVNHIYKVLRLRVSDNIRVCDTDSLEYECEIISISKTEVKCAIVSKINNISEPPIKITLFQGLPKSQKMDIIVQKCVEIGIYEIQPVVTDRTVVKIEAKEISGKIDRWNKISYEASKQSGRGIVPCIYKPVTFNQALEKVKLFDFSIVPYENEKISGIKSILFKKSKIKNIAIFIGPEGGFEESEIKDAEENGIIPVTLGPRILRTETAGFIASAFILYDIGDMGGSK